MNSTEKVKYDMFAYKEHFLYMFVFLMFMSLTPQKGFGFDMMCWEEWCVYLKYNGLTNTYNSWTDYPPVYNYILAFFGWLKGDENAIRTGIFHLKYITLFFEFCSLFILFPYIKKKFRPWFFLFIILSPGFFYNSVIWGQVDGILAFFILSSILLAVNRQNTLALFIFILALNFKLQAIIFLPLLLFILIHNLSDYKGILYSISVIAVLILFELLILSPFIYSNTLHLLFNVLFNLVDRYPRVSVNAYNMWNWFFVQNPTDIIDSGLFQNISYKTWGLIIFFTSSVFALLPLFIDSIQSAINKNPNKYQSIDKVFISGALITLLFFFCNTQMHERYSHYALLFLAAYYAVSGRYLPFLLISCAYFLNMEAILMALHLPNYHILLFNRKFVALIYLALIIYLFYLNYKNFNLLQQIKNLSVRKI